MSDAVIRVEGLSKRYIIGHQRDQRDGLRHRLEEAFQKPLGWLKQGISRCEAALPPSGGARLPRGRAQPTEEFWALKDVSFEVKQGEVVGILGRNGAGKSTLLKILSRITEPTNGRIHLRGRVASLLEVGTGFHQELTGRENIYLNGAILGMSRAEIKRKFDEIVAFSEVEKFLDTPVKRYSSGMYVRLAFAVAAHLEPEILIVDEVLAVGDAAFQQKCLGKMGQVAEGGRTVLFVSHNMGALRQLCSHAVLLEHGVLTCAGVLREVAERYLAPDSRAQSHFQRNGVSTEGRRGIITEASLTTGAGKTSDSFSSTEPIIVEIKVSCFDAIPACQLAVRLCNAEGIPVFTTTNVDEQDSLTSLNAGLHGYRFTIPQEFLSVGRYSLTLSLCIPGVEMIDGHSDILVFNIFDGVTHATRFHDQRKGLVTPLLSWKHSYVAQQ